MERRHNSLGGDSMSTLKSSAEHLTLNADGSGNDIKFQSNATEVAAIDQSGNLTLSGTVDGVDIQTLNTTAGAALPKAGGIMTGDTGHGDNVKSKYGTSGDLEVFHDGTHSYIKDVGTGDLTFSGDANISFLNSALNEYKAQFISNGAVNLYYDNVAKFSTTSAGIDVAGTISRNGDVMGNVIFHDHVGTLGNHSISNTQTTWSTILSKTFTPQSANSYFYAEVYHNEHINTQTPNYGGGVKIMEGSTEIVRGGQMKYATIPANVHSYNGDAKTFGGWHSPNSATALTFTVQITGVNSQSGNNYYFHWNSGYIANMPAPRLRVVEFT